MEYEIVLNIQVDPEANFLEVDNRFNCQVITELILNAMHDIDDVTINNCEVNKNA